MAEHLQAVCDTCGWRGPLRSTCWAATQDANAHKDDWDE
jgi:hypothetical protein